MSANRRFSFAAANTRFLLWASVVIIAWAGIPVLAKSGAGHLNGFEMTFWINLFALPIVTLWILPTQHRLTLSTYRKCTIIELAGIGVLGNLMYQILYFSSYNTISAFTGALLTRLGYVLFVVASIVFLNERHSRIYLVAFVLAIVGSILAIVKPEGNSEVSFTTGFWLMVLANVLNAAYSYLNNGIKLRLPDAKVNLFVFKVTTMAAIILWAIVTRSGLIEVGEMYQIGGRPSLPDLIPAFVIGVLGDGVGFLAFLKMLEFGDSIKAFIVGSIVVILQLLLAYLFFRDTAGVINSVLAPALIIVPSIIAWVRENAQRNAGGDRL